MRSFHEQTDFKTLLLADADVTKVLPAAEIEKAFDLKEQLRNVDAVFAECLSERLVGEATALAVAEECDEARVYVTLKPSVFDPQGRVVADALVTLGYHDVTGRAAGQVLRSRARRRRPGHGQGARDRDGRQAARQPGDRELPRRGLADPGSRSHEVLGRRLSRIELGLRRLLCRLARPRRAGRADLAQGHRPQGRRRRDSARRLRARRLPAHRRDRALLADHGARSRRSPNAAARCSASATASRCCSKPACCRARWCATTASSSSRSWCRFASSRPTRRSPPRARRSRCCNMPIAHGEGNYYAPPDVLERARSRIGRSIFRYADAAGDVSRRITIRTARSTASPASAIASATSWA